MRLIGRVRRSQQDGGEVREPPRVECAVPKVPRRNRQRRQQPGERESAGRSDQRRWPYPGATEVEKVCKPDECAFDRGGLLDLDG
jgi:hypothetical protein